jgi:hypothetical protein
MGFKHLGAFFFKSIEAITSARNPVVVFECVDQRGPNAAACATSGW